MKEGLGREREALGFLRGVFEDLLSKRFHAEKDITRWKKNSFISDKMQIK